MLVSALLFTALRAQALPYATFVEENAANGLEDSADIRFGDADNDGDLDIVTCGRIGAGTNRDLYILAGDGAGNFAAPVSIPPAGANNGVGMCALALGDMDSDGDLDVVVTGRGTGAANNNQFLRVYLRGAAAWTLTTVLGGGGNSVESGGLALGDYDNDGDLDILSTGMHQNSQAILTRIYQNNGAGTAYTAITPTGVTNIWNGGAAWGDFNADGWLDMLMSGATDAANATEQLRVYRSNAGASWTAIDLTPALTLSDVAWGDFNGDGLLDVVAMGSDGANEQIRWWQNNGAGGFGAAQLVAAANAGLSEGRLAVGDVDRDGDLDVVASGSANSATAAINVYTNSGAGVFTLNAIANGLWDGSLALADANGNGTLDMAAVGLDTAANRRIRYYPSTSAANTAPNAPGGLSATFTYAASPAMSTAAFQWSPAADAGAGATPANLLHYDIQISTINNAFASGLYVFPSMDGASPRRGAYQRPPLVGGLHTVYLRSTSPLDAEPAPYGLQDSTTYYFRVRTIDAGLMESAWSATGTLFTGVPPSAVTTLAVAAATVDGQILLNWTAPVGAQGGAYDVRWALSAITSDALFNAATPLDGEPTPGATGAAQTMNVRGVPPEQTVFFALKTVNVSGTSAVSNSPSGTPLAFDRTQIEVDGAAGTGLDRGDVAWGDMDGDGYFDIVAQGMDETNTRELRVYLSTGNGAGFVLDQTLAGISHGNLDLGDYDGDGDLDVIASGNDGVNRHLRVHRNNSTLGNISLTAGTAVQAGNGFDYVATNGSGCGLKWADMNSDGDLDIVVCGQDTLSGLPQLYLYFNQGNGTFASPIDITTPAGSPEFFQWGDLAVSDFDGDGKMDVAAQGFDEAGVAAGDMRTAVYRGNGAGGFTATILANGLGSGGLDAGDYNNDGRPDLLASGYHGVGANGRDIRVYANTSTPGAISFAAPTLLENNAGLNRGEAAFGDYNNDGRLDVFVAGAPDGVDGTDGELRLYAGTVTGWAADIPMDGTIGLVNEGAVAWGDFDQDGDADMVVSGRTDVGAAFGSPQLRVYRNHWASTPGGVNNPPSTPPTVAADFVFSPVGTSTASFKWNPATDDITAQAALRYQVQAATTTPAYSAPLAINSPSPQTFPMTFDGNTRHGTVLISTNPWDPQSGTLTGLVTDTTYYFRVKAIDGGSLESGWSSDGFLWTGVAPGSSTIAAASGVPGQSSVTWSSPGDDLFRGNLTTGSSYRLQYSTSAATAWSASATPTGAFTTVISTNNQVPGTAQTAVLTGLTEGTSYYFRLWTQDDAGQWSAISNQTTAYIMIGTRDLVLSTGAYNFGAVGLALSTQTTTAVTVTYTGNVNSTYRIYAATITAGSPWSLAAAPGADQMRLYAAFNAAQPSFAAFGAEDVVLAGSQVCTASAFALTQNCLNLTPGAVRNLWFRLDMPTISSEATAQEQHIQVTVEAGPP